MRQFLTFFILLSSTAFSQSPDFYPQEHWRVSGYGMAFNVEVHDINNDGKLDIIVGNWNDTYVYYGGAGVLDTTVDITYTGRMLAVCDYNGDGYKDLIAMHFTNYDSSRFDYDGEILFYYGSNTTELAIDTIPEYSIPLPTLYPTRDEFSIGLGRPGIEYGDFNNDGKVDLVINSHDYPLQGQYGYIYIYMGSETPTNTATFSISGKVIFGEISIKNYGDYFQVGDVNGDGYDDLLLSSKRNKLPPAPNPKDSLDVLHIYMGGENFEFVEDGETLKYESRLKHLNYSYGWFKREFSVMDINGDGFSDLIISHLYKDSTNHVHYGSINGLDTIPSFYITDPDTTREDVVVGPMCHDVGDWNNDGEGDFLLKQSYYKSFTLHLGGPYINNRNPYGMKGLLEAVSSFPTKAINCGDQNGDGVKDFVVTAFPYSQDYLGYVIIYKGRDDIVVNVANENIERYPTEFYLQQNYPNPFNASTIIKYQLSTRNYITIKIFDVLGKKIATLFEEEKPAGEYELEFNASKYNLASGIYFCELRIKDGNSARIKMVYLK